MACRAILGRGLVEQDCLRSDRFCQLVTFRAPDVLVSAAQREGGPLLMIEQGRLPFHAVMAIGAGCGFPFGKLLPVGILVAILAYRGRGLEVRVDQLSFEVWRFVAVNAGRGPVSSQQRKLGLGVVKARQFLPGLGGVAGLATGRSAIGPNHLHALFELTLVGIVVATGAVKVFPMVDDGWFGLELRRFLVAVRARYSDVPAGQREMSLLVLDECKG